MKLIPALFRKFWSVTMPRVSVVTKHFKSPLQRHSPLQRPPHSHKNPWYAALSSLSLPLDRTLCPPPPPPIKVCCFPCLQYDPGVISSFHPAVKKSAWCFRHHWPKPLKTATEGYAPGPDRVMGLFWFFRVNTCANLSVPVSSSCAQHTPRSLHVLKLSGPTFG